MMPRRHEMKYDDWPVARRVEVLRPTPDQGGEASVSNNVRPCNQHDET